VRLPLPSSLLLSEATRRGSPALSFFFACPPSPPAGRPQRPGFFSFETSATRDTMSPSSLSSPWPTMTHCSYFFSTSSQAAC